MLSRPRFLSVCSGIEAASVAFQPLGWEAVAFAEIEAFPSALLALHYPTVPNLGDLRRFREWDHALLAAANILCGGTPCQAFSVAGLRGSLDDERGNLTLTFCHLYDHLDQIRHLHGRPPAVCLWENVPGILSDKQNAFGCFLAGLAGEDEPLRPPGARWTDAGYVRGPTRAVAWRVLDAQYCGLAQRRERVFVVASADPAVDPAAVLFEFAGLRRDTPPRRGQGEATAPTLSARAKGGGGLGTDADCDGACIAEGGESQAVPAVSRALRGQCQSAQHEDKETFIPEVAGALEAQRGQRGQRNNPAHETWCIETAGTLNANGKAAGSATQQDAEQGLLITETAHTLRAEGFDASEDGTGRGTPLVPVRDEGTLRLGDEENSSPIAFCAKDHGADATPALCPTLRAGNHDKSHANSGNWAAIAFPERLSGTQCASEEELSPVLQSRNPTAVCHREIAPAITGNYGKQPDNSDPALGPMLVSEAEPFAFDLRGREGGAMPEGPHPTANMRASSGGSSRSYVAAPEAKAYTLHGQREGTQEIVSPTDVAGTIREGTGSAIQNSSNTVVQSAWKVRRLTPEECEVLQGFPIGYTLLPQRQGRLRKGSDLAETCAYLEALGFDPAVAATLAHSPDGPRYKALGNSWAVPVARWIGQRIDAALREQPSTTVNDGQPRQPSPKP